MKLFDSSKPFFKGNFHVHTSCSDGVKTPEEVMELYSSQGYDFLAITDHWTSLPEQKWGDMLVLCGAEYDFTFPDQVLHLLGIFPDFKASQGFERGMRHPEVIARINAAGGAAIAAHPAWSMNTQELLMSLDGVCAAEVCNTLAGTPWSAPRGDASAILDLTATAGKLYRHIAADDSHYYTGEACVSYTMVQADACTPEKIIEAIKSGAFYASQGPRILDAMLTDRELIVYSTPVQQCCFISNLWWVEGRCRRGKDMTEHIYPLQKEKGETFIRCELTDEAGRRAWLSPISL